MFKCIHSSKISDEYNRSRNFLLFDKKVKPLINHTNNRSSLSQTLRPISNSYLKIEKQTHDKLDYKSHSKNLLLFRNNLFCILMKWQSISIWLTFYIIRLIGASLDLQILFRFTNGSEIATLFIDIFTLTNTLFPGTQRKYLRNAIVLWVKFFSQMDKYCIDVRPFTWFSSNNWKRACDQKRFSSPFFVI